MLKNLFDPDDDVALFPPEDVVVVVLPPIPDALLSRLMVDKRADEVDGDDRFAASFEIFCLLLGEEVGDDDDVTALANGEDALSKCCGG